MLFVVDMSVCTFNLIYGEYLYHVRLLFACNKWMWIWESGWDWQMDFSGNSHSLNMHGTNWKDTNDFFSSFYDCQYYWSTNSQEEKAPEILTV